MSEIGSISGMERPELYLLLDESEHFSKDTSDEYNGSALYLWDNKRGEVSSGVLYSEDDEI